MRFDLVLSSPLHRARHTAAAFGNHDIDHDLIEVDLGGWEGLTIHEVIRRPSL
jgi:broad specificity phosphatase PhoE